MDKVADRRQMTCYMSVTCQLYVIHLQGAILDKVAERRQLLRPHVLGRVKEAEAREEAVDVERLGLGFRV